MNSSKKIGRPTNDPKTIQITVRVSPEDDAILNDYSKQKRVNKREAIRHGIKKLKADIQK